MPSPKHVCKSSFATGHFNHRNTVPSHLRSQTKRAVHHSTRWIWRQARQISKAEEDSRRFPFEALNTEGDYETINILPTPKATVGQLQLNLRELNLGENGYPHRWYIDPSGDAIHAFRLSQDVMADDSIRIITEIANTREFRHHPHLSYDRISTAPGQPEWTVLTATCTTHQPHGLGLRDTKLARRIDRVLVYLGFSDARVLDSWSEDQKEGVSKIEDIFGSHVAAHQKAMAEIRRTIKTAATS